MEQVKIKVAGFGGQGIMLFGQILAYSASKEELNGLWFPSYGPETRGGTANCSVIISKNKINSPVFREATHLVMFNGPSLDKFENSIESNGLILYNASLIQKTKVHDHVKYIGVPINDIALSLGNAQVANMVMMGAYLELTHLFDEEVIFNVLKKLLGDKKAHLLEINQVALNEGRKYIQKQGAYYA